MSWSKATVFQRSSGLHLTLHSANRVTLSLGARTLVGDHATLAILEAFATPVRMEDAIASLQPKLAGFAAFTQVMHQIQELIDAGMIRLDDAATPIDLGTDSTSFDSLPVHIRMLNDTARTSVFQEAIRRTVTSDDVVLDIGTGTGILAATAALAGARHVYAIERTAMARVARKVMAANGVAGRTTVIEASSLDVNLPEKATVLVGEIVGDDPLQEGLRTTFADAVRRHLAPDARLLPERIRIVGQPLTVPDDVLGRVQARREHVERWRRAYGLDLSALAEVGTLHAQFASCSTFASRDWPRPAGPIALIDLDLRTADSGRIEVVRELTSDAGGTLSGVQVHFELLLGAAGWFSIGHDAVTSGNHWNSPIWVPGAPVELVACRRYSVTYTVDKDRSNFKLDGPA